MSDRANELGDADLEEALIDLGKEMPYPLTPDLAAPVRECIERAVLPEPAASASM